MGAARKCLRARRGCRLLRNYVGRRKCDRIKSNLARGFKPGFQVVMGSSRGRTTGSWLDANGSVYEGGASISEEEAATFVKAIDCYVLGSRTYEHALERAGHTATLCSIGTVEAVP